MFRNLLGLILVAFTIIGCKSESGKNQGTIQLDPISHATMILSHDDLVIYVDPVGGAETFSGKKSADLILITDIHGDHLNIETLESVLKENTVLIVPEAVANRLQDNLKTNLKLLANGETTEFELKNESISVEAIPMYNLREEALKFHEKGRGNGYVLTLDDQRIYISGDTEDIPEMRSLDNIDIAFVCMNLPWTMPVENAADAVLEFKPKLVYPYHYRGTNGLSDVQNFKKIITEKNPDIDVRLLNWYP